MKYLNKLLLNIDMNEMNDKTNEDNEYDDNKIKEDLL